MLTIVVMSTELRASILSFAEYPLLLIIKAAPAAPRPALPAPSHSQAAVTRLVMGGSRRYVFLALDCPDRGHRVQGGPAGRHMRSAPPILDPASTHLVLAPTRKTGTEQLIGAIQPPDLLSC